MPTWPHSFPPLFSPDGASYDPISNATVIDTESGEPLSRLRFTGEMDDFTGTLPLCDTETAVAIKNFWRYDLKNGALRFTWDDPLTAEGRDFLMTAPPKIVPYAGGHCQVSLKLMMLP